MGAQTWTTHNEIAISISISNEEIRLTVNLSSRWECVIVVDLQDIKFGREEVDTWQTVTELSKEMSKVLFSFLVFLLTPTHSQNRANILDYDFKFIKLKCSKPPSDKLCSYLCRTASISCLFCMRFCLHSDIFPKMKKTKTVILIAATNLHSPTSRKLVRGSTNLTKWNYNRT